MNILKKILSLILLVLISIGILSALLLFSVQQNITKPQFYLKAFNQTDIYEETAAYIDSDLKKSFLEGSKIQMKNWQPVITKEWVSNQTATLVSGLTSYIAGKTESLPILNYDDPLKSLTSNSMKSIQQYIEVLPAQERKRVEAELTAEINKTTQEIPFTSSWNKINGNEITDELSPARQFLSQLRQINMISLAVIFFGLAFLFLLNRSHSLRWIGAAFILGSLLSVGSAVWIKELIRTERLTNDLNLPSAFPSLSQSLTLMENTLFNSLYLKIALLTTIGLLLILVQQILKHKKKSISIQG